MLTITVKAGQSLLDIAMEHGGSADAAFALAEANGLSVTSTLTPGQELKSVPAFNEAVQKYYAAHGISPANAIKSEGVGYWFIEIDFIVS